MMSRPRLRISVLMFLGIGSWGAWNPILGRHLETLGFSPAQIGAVYGTGGLALMISPLLAGQIADRQWPLSRILFLLLSAAGTLFALAGTLTEFRTTWWVMFAAMLCFSPVPGLLNALAFHVLPEKKKDFPFVRAFGTVGWIASGWILSLWMKLMERPIGDCLTIAAIFSLCGAGYALTIPGAFPKQNTQERLAIGQVFKLLRTSSFRLFCALLFLLFVFVSFHYYRAGNFLTSVGFSDAALPLVMSTAQIAEVCMLFSLPWIYRRLGAKRTILLGFGAWTLRFVLYALGGAMSAAWLPGAAQFLHGACFACLAAAAMIYLESISPPDVRATVQNFFLWLTYGLGMFVGAHVSGQVIHWTSPAGGVAWPTVWLVAAGGCLSCLALFALFFRPSLSTASTGDAHVVVSAD
jgi:nucleoside transporter